MSGHSGTGLPYASGGNNVTDFHELSSDGTLIFVNPAPQAGIMQANDNVSLSLNDSKGSNKQFLTDNQVIREIDESVRCVPEREKELWQKVEDVMAERLTKVLQVLKDFGIADIRSSPGALEEQIWQIVQGETTFRELTDLV